MPGTGTCEGDARFSVTEDAPARILGDGTVNGTGTFGLPDGTTIQDTSGEHSLTSLAVENAKLCSLKTSRLTCLW